MWFGLGVFAGGMALRLYGAGARSMLPSVPHVDLKGYARTWCEIARYPKRFQKKCASDTAATYSLRDDGKVGVVTRCRKANGEITTATGNAKVVDASTN